MQVHYFMNTKAVMIIWHLIKKHKQLPGLLYRVKSDSYIMQVQDVTGRAVLQVKKFNMI